MRNSDEVMEKSSDLLIGSIILKLSQEKNVRGLMEKLQTLDKKEFIEVIQSLPEESVKSLWETLFHSTDINHLRNLLDVLTQHTPEVMDVTIMQSFPFEMILELEASDADRKQWLVKHYLVLYECYPNRSLVLPPKTQFCELVRTYVRNLPPNEQLRYVDYAKPEVITSARSISEKIANEVIFPSKCNIFNVHCLVLGNAGVGKSTLTNVAHNEKVFEEAVGGSSVTMDYMSATKTFERFRHAGIEDANSIPDVVPVRVTFTDSPGPSQNYISREEAVDSFQSFLEWFHVNTLENRPHLALYCVNASSNRISDYQYFWMISLARFIPVILVMTSSFSSNTRKAWEHDHLNRDNFKKIGLESHVFVNLREVVDDDYTIPVFGLDKLSTTISKTFNKNICKYLEERILQINEITYNNGKRAKLYKYCHGIWAAGIIASTTAGSIPAAWVNDVATVGTITTMLSAMTTAYGLIGIIGTREVWELMKKSLAEVGFIQVTAIGGLLALDQIANVLMAVPCVGLFLGSGLSGTCSGVAAFLCGKIWWGALEEYRLEFIPGTDDPHDFLCKSIVKKAHEAWDNKSKIITEMNELIRKEQFN